ncbi:heat stress transcription factor A-5 [Pistacia vera]|uniref:heat stress transcription factor A-5 n=1 Tax=Pistacia vera TaxID=55513 RepID=UPI0012636AC1|nr:heat stress transcription factor A-5 [Pistacia vera]
MDASASACGSGGGPAPFLLKTYDMVDDSSTDEIVSWSSNKNSFVVWNPPEFARLLLPTYFKHNNFSSFIRQLNTYGFRKIDPEKWEFSNEDFVKDQKHLLKNIHRRKPIHSHSHPQGSSMDPERAAFEEEIEKFSREKAALEANILRVKQQRSAAKLQLEDMTQRVDSMEQRQHSLLSFLEKAIQNPTFVEHLARKIESMDISAYKKKRRVPQVDFSKPVDSSLLDNSSSSRPEFGNIFHQDFSNKLRLELSPAVSDINLLSHSTQSSNEDGGSPQRKISEGDTKEAQTRIEGNLFVPETFELSDTGTSFTFKMDSSLSRKVSANDSPRVHSLQQRLTSSEDTDGHLSCHLNLTLASSPLQVNKGLFSSTIPQPSHDIGRAAESRYNSNEKESDTRSFPKNKNLSNEDVTLSSSQETANNNPVTLAAPARINDVFWEQFLTERPGSSDNEEASSCYRANPYEEQEDRRQGQGISRNAKNIEQLTL